ncbi:serine/threonine-protein kinase 11-interacting protein isoform X2 [Pseudomyrmex gracilis]|uniref:serine/threonine-protein kinase 11-interacting protein isoform X2 n=1 Tax=Pseudomyrmex gracilis TaxID=219809 RepID=UPI000994D2E9|nr:serine/threonine-protein kinase 11-interacting protein isoform X2 [Pseudomyrmex gracilis]
MASRLQDTVSMQGVVELAKILRQNGDELLSASSKLSLSTKLLNSLNEAFSLIVVESEELDTSFHVCNSSKIDIFHDVKFLHDFVQKIVGLKVTHCSSDVRVIIDISKFKHLKYLELRKVSIEWVKGLQSVRGQLESILCTGRKGVSTISQLLAECGGDTVGIGFVWASLKQLILPHNALEHLDESLELAPWLQILDLSHNMITSAKEISCLSNLKYVNLGYNKLEEVPVFNKTALHLLQVLVLKNNYIENLIGLEGLECLTELDLSYNCLMEHSMLWPLQTMSTLMWMSLEGNPLSYHPQHRALSIIHLHPSLSDSKFVLDHLPLSKLEKSLIAENRVFTIRANLSKSLNSSISTYMTDTSEFTEDASNLQSASCETLDDNSVPNSVPKSKKKLKKVIIAEIDQDKEEFKKLPDVVASSHMNSSKTHLEMKERIKALREKFGEDNWLSSQGGTFVQNIMGLHSSPQPSTPPIPKIKTWTDITTAPTLYDTLIYTMNNENSSDASKLNETTEYAVEDENVAQDEGIVPDELPNLELSMPNELPDSDEEVGDLYFVRKRKNDEEMEDIFLAITPEDIKEKNTLNGKVMYCWSTNSVLSCVLGRSDPPTVDIIFDTTRKDRENRRYFVELEDAKKIVATLNAQIEMRPILLKIFKCMKCSTQFSQEEEYETRVVKSLAGVKQLKCPTCNSTLVIEIDAPSNADAETAKTQSAESTVKSNLKHSESISSIGGMEGGAKSVTTSLHSDSHTQAQVCCSATSLDESRESTPSANAITKKYESDIEILSNPSQSSIEVLDETQKTNVTPIRKCSTEEKRAAIASSLITIPDTTPVLTGLTESSSSGSLTDSICTAYENKMSKSMNIDTKSHSSDGEKESGLPTVTNLTSMLGGLLQSIKVGSNKMLKDEETSSLFGTSVQYSYTDFSSVDHRIKLHIILNVFEYENEELVLLLRAEILMNSTQETFPGCLVLSTSKVYVLRIDGPEGEDPQRWLHKEISWTMDRLRSFVPLPFKQGVLIELQQSSKIGEEHLTIPLLCILQDFQRTSNFLFYLTDLHLPPSCEVEFSVPEHCNPLMQNLLTNTANYQNGDVVRLLAIFSSAILKYQNVTTKLKLSGLILTTSALVILKDNVQWLIPRSNQVPVVAREQAMSNLLSIEHCDSTLTLNFLDEVAGLEEKWNLSFVSPGAVEAVISSVQSPWEELFSIPLQVTKCVSQDNNAEKM